MHPLTHLPLSFRIFLPAQSGSQGSGQIIDELLGCPSGKSAVEQLPLVRFRKKLLLRERNVRPLSQRLHDLLKLRLVRRAEINGHAEAVYQGQLFLNGIVGMQILVPLLFIAEILPDQMSSVGGGAALFRREAAGAGLQEILKVW